MSFVRNRIRSSRLVVLWVSWCVLVCLAAGSARAQSLSGSIQGTVTDPSKAIVPGATVRIENPVSGYARETMTDSNGAFQFGNIPFNPYHLTVTQPGFANTVQDVDVRSSVPIQLQIALTIGTASSSVTVEAAAEDLIETASTFHTDVDRSLIDTLPLESQSSSVSSLVTLSSPGVVADSNGLFHGLGDHAENSFSVDGQPITDQQSKVFSNQIPLDSIQSMEVVSGAPGAEYGGKTSLVINVTTRSGLGQTQPTGQVTASYGSFGSVNGGMDVAFGGNKWGDFISANGLNTGRFLDPPEFQVMHAKGNQQNLFDRMDFQVNDADTIHLNAGFTRSWFQTPNSFDTQALGEDQRAQIKTFNIAPTWSHLINPSTLYTLGAFVRQDRFNYYPSADPLADLNASVAQQRKLTNVGLRSDISYVAGIHNFKAGALFQHTFLTENFQVGITDPTFNAPCVNTTDGQPVADPAPTNPADCTMVLGSDFAANPNFASQALPYDFTRGGASYYPFHGTADIKEIALYAQDTITKGPWSISLGLRGDLYRGLLSRDSQVEPRLGLAYNIKPSNTVLRVSYARVLESPFNENLVLATIGGNDPVIGAILGASAPIRAGQRNEFHGGFQQAFGRYLSVDADYMWKYTHNAYDFGVFADNVPIFFPISWNNSKIQGYSVRVNLPTLHGLTAFTVLSGVSARFFPTALGQTGGLGAGSGAGDSVFRIDHDQKFQQTTHVRYQPRTDWPWLSFNWRYDGGLVAGAVPVADGAALPVAGLGDLTADQQAQAGLFCGNVFATLTTHLDSCTGQDYGSTGISLPAPGTADDDKNPPRIAPRHLFDVAAGDDNLFHADRYKWSLQFTVINLTNKVALYNFLSTFSGTHFVTPRTYTAEVGFHF
jgi:Carboxypeptidase regulatory-like domain/TonB-dependent Receptor Plug Domain